MKIHSVITLLTITALWPGTTHASDRWIAEFGRVGPIRIGMSPVELSSLLRQRFQMPDDPRERGCVYVQVGQPKGLLLMFVDGRLARIDVTSREFPTTEGARVAEAGRSTDGGAGSAMKAVRTSSSRWWEAPNRAPAVRRREFAALGRLARHFAQRGSPWQVGAAGFEARVQLREPGLVGVAVYKVHLVGWEDSRARFHASVTVWPRATAVRRGRTTREASRAWCETCRLALARYGYRGGGQRVRRVRPGRVRSRAGLRILRGGVRHAATVGGVPVAAWRVRCSRHLRPG